MIIIIAIGIFCAFICYAICAVPKSAEEQMREDEAQIKWIKEHVNKGSMVKH